MTNGKLRQYYWRIYSFLAEHSQILDVHHEAFQFPDESLVELGEIFQAVIVFYDGSRLVVQTRLDATENVQEYDYAYVYLDQAGRRILQYDDAPHHQDISTHPHHRHVGTRPSYGNDEAHPLDIPQIDFFTVVLHIEKEFLR